ncbi:MAG: winged helix-turn-helix transcriptional regulator [Thermoplasmatota archaeon]
MDGRMDPGPPPGPLKTNVTDLIAFLARPHLHPLLFYLGVSADGPVRFQEIPSATGIPRNTLVRRLKDLAAAGWITRQELGQNPPHVEYAPTATLKNLVPAFKALHGWCVEHELPLREDA